MPIEDFFEHNRHRSCCPVELEGRGAALMPPCEYDCNDLNRICSKPETKWWMVNLKRDRKEGKKKNPSFCDVVSSKWTKEKDLRESPTPLNGRCPRKLLIGESGTAYCCCRCRFPRFVFSSHISYQFFPVIFFFLSYARKSHVRAFHF